MNLGVLLFVFGLSAVVCSADEPSAPADTAADAAAAAPAADRTAADAAAAAPAADGTADDADDSGKFFLFAQRSLTTSFTITTSKTEVLPTCYKAIATTPCAGRRRRRFVKMDRNYPSVDGEENLDSSLSASIDDDGGVADHPNEEPVQNSKYFFTVWQTSTSTIQVVSTSTNTVNTVSVSAWCSIAGNTYSVCPTG